ncbi:MAG: electron transfer flavoprotein subunit beta/FixA family protein [Anaeromusa sp.]|uniref:electron transfer flavoprotein subunit beta/FixA family protein n=1 Tax=Anaeromusa sp. TaxID=1872520 RepID=UPI002B208D25|nr:electron transfer flavoprotein subunit beta/FixA family protein [Anaeromusa sp.]MEA4835452.1 electron transfer flavoprotein subunit beta/FixA family protein [Anaeromusa sp.]
MKILVCVKQVPDTTEVRIDRETNTLQRQDVPSILNPFDRHALEEALRVKERCGGTVSVLTMGPLQAQEVLKECLALGADEAVLVSDKAFAGADTLATSRTLAAAIAKLQPAELIFCGKQAIDGDTAQVGPELAEYLNMAQITCVSKLEVFPAERRLIAEREVEDGHEVLELSFPAVLTVSKSLNEPRYPSIKGRLRANKTSIPILMLAELGLQAEETGLQGSPTRVVRIFAPETRKGGEVIQGMAPRQAADLLAIRLKQAGIF